MLTAKASLEARDGCSGATKHPRRALVQSGQQKTYRWSLLGADSDDLARVYRFDLAQDSEMISPTIPTLMSARGVRRSGVLVSGIGEAARSTLNHGLRLRSLLLLLLWACSGSVGDIERNQHTGLPTTEHYRLSEGVANRSQSRQALEYRDRSARTKLPRTSTDILRAR
jgi:hypothetical protein